MKSINKRVFWKEACIVSALLLIINPQLFSQTWTSDVGVGDNHRGNWSDNNTWDIADDIANFGVGDDVFIISGDTITHVGDLTLGFGEDVFVQSGGLFIVSGNFTMASSFSDLEVSAGGGLIIDGNANISGNADFEIAGSAVVTGDFTYGTTGAGEVSDAGQIYVIGTTTNTGCTGTCNVTEASEQDLANDEPTFLEVVNSETGSTLPVEWVSFGYTTKLDQHYLYWETASELNNSGFEIQRRTKGDAEYQTLDFVEGHGTTNEPQYYEFVIPQTSADQYYRLKQLDYDGKFEFSEELRAQGSLLSRNLVYPNPTYSEVNIDFDQIIFFQLSTVDGAVMISGAPHSNEEAEQRLSDQLAKSKKGQYLLTLQSVYEKKTTRIIKQ